MTTAAQGQQTLLANRWMRRLLWTIGTIVALWALAWLLVPPVLKSQLVKAAGTELGRTLTVGEIDFKPWTLELTVNDLVVATQDGKGRQLAIKRLYANAELESLLRLAPVVQTLSVDGPAIWLRHLGEGKYDIDDILARFAAAAKPDARPLRFALFNLAVRDGSADVDDQSAGQVHQLRGLNLSLPFLSNLESRRAITVTPELAFTLNGSAFDSSAAATPFAETHKTDARLRVLAMDLAPYLRYIPSSVPVRLQKAVLDAELQFQFVQLAKPQLRVSGQLQLTGVAVADTGGGPLLAFDSLKVGLDGFQPLERRIQIGAIELQSPQLTARRDADGRINMQLAGSDAPAAPDAPATTPGTGGGADWNATVAKVVVRDGSIGWTDNGIAPGARLQLFGLTLDASDMAWPMERPLVFNGSLSIAQPASESTAGSGKSAPSAAAPGPAVGAAAAAQLKFDGTATDDKASVKLALRDASLELAAPYLAQFLVPTVQGRLDTNLGVEWRGSELQLAIASLTLEQLALVPAPGAGGAKAGLPSVRKIELSDAQVDLGQRRWTVGKLELHEPELAVQRGVDKRWMFEQWFKPSPTATASKAASAQPPAGAAAPWQGRLEQFELRGGVVHFLDQAGAKPVQLGVSALSLDVKGMTSDLDQPKGVLLSARVASGQGQPGQIDYRGTVVAAPLQAKGNIQMAQFPLHALEPYFGAGLNIEILRADAGFKGDIDYQAAAAGPVLRLRGDTVLEDFRANSAALQGADQGLSRELLNWKALGLRGVELAMAPGQPMRLAVRETTLSDFYARVIVHENGRINLQDLVRGDAPAAVASVPVPVTGARHSAAAASAGNRGPAIVAAAAPATAVAAAAKAPPDPLAPVIWIGPVSLVQGKVFFSDRFVKPNYSANLSELTGKLSAFSSSQVQGQPQMADLELRGRAEGTASLEILGKLNPLAEPLALDIKGTVRDLELPPLSPYSIKYAGYGIERGKLSVDVAYQVLPNGQLTASNKVVLNQLAFGNKVEGAPNSLPVKLAVALLADRSGVIDINLPISGSLNDPQFRLGPVIGRVIINLIGKALTAPFTLLASAFGGGGAELSQVAFPAGSPVLAPDARAGLDKVAKALTDRPALKMTVIGTANLDTEREAYKQRQLSALLRAEKRRAQVNAGATPVASDTQSDPELEPAEAAELLKQVFQRSEIAKPRDLAGKPKELTPADMLALLLANIPANEEAMRELALQRGVAVKDYLASRQLPLERLFLGAAKLADADPKWSPRAELSLGTN